MFQMIAIIIALVLTVLVAIASIFYGGTVFTNQSNRASLAGYEQGAQQIVGAMIFYSNDYGSPPTGTSDQILATLVSGNYLNTIPPGGFTITGLQVTAPLSSPAYCDSLNVAAGLQSICPPCSDDTYSQYPACTQ